MPKSGQSRRRHMARSKKKAGKRSHPVAVGQQQAITPTQEAITRPMPAPSVSMRTPKTVPSAISSTDVTRELRRIGILTAIMLIILVVLSRVLA